MREMSPDFRVQGLGGRLWGLGYSSTYLRMCAHVCAHTHSLSLSLIVYTASSASRQFRKRFRAEAHRSRRRHGLVLSLEPFGASMLRI